MVGEDKKIMLDSLVSWHRGTSLPKMISSIKDRRLWTNMIINTIWKKNYSHSIGSSCYASTFTLPTDTIKSINIPRWVKLFCSRLVLFFNTPHLIPGLWYTHKLIHGMIIWWTFFFFFKDMHMGFCDSTFDSNLPLPGGQFSVLLCSSAVPTFFDFNN